MFPRFAADCRNTNAQKWLKRLKTVWSNVKVIGLGCKDCLDISRVSRNCQVVQHPRGDRVNVFACLVHQTSNILRHSFLSAGFHGLEQTHNSKWIFASDSSRWFASSTCAFCLASSIGMELIDYFECNKNANEKEDTGEREECHCSPQLTTSDSSALKGTPGMLALYQ